MKHLSPFTSIKCVDFRLEKENDTQIFFHEHMNTINTADVNVFRLYISIAIFLCMTFGVHC